MERIAGLLVVGPHSTDVLGTIGHGRTEHPALFLGFLRFELCQSVVPRHRLRVDNGWARRWARALGKDDRYRYDHNPDDYQQRNQRECPVSDWTRWQAPQPIGSQVANYGQANRVHEPDYPSWPRTSNLHPVSPLMRKSDILSRMAGSLIPVRERIAWARERFQQLETACDGFMYAKPDETATRIAVETHGEPGLWTARAIVPEPLPSNLTRLVGEILYHLRGSLDNLAWQLVLANNGTPGLHTEFPVFKDKTPFDELEILDLMPLTTDLAADAAALIGTGRGAVADAVHLATARAAGATAFVTDDRRIRSTPRLDVVYLSDLT